MRSSSLRKWICQLSRTGRYAVTLFPAKRKTTLISHFNGSSSTQSHAGAEKSQVVFQLLLPCYRHVTSSSLCNDVQSYLHLHFTVLYCFACVTFFFWHFTFFLILKQIPTMHYNNSEEIGIIHLVKLYFNREWETIFELPFCVFRHYTIDAAR